MAARKWTVEQRAAQSAAIRKWQPWEHSTGPRTPSGKTVISRNAYRGGIRRYCRFIRWFYRAIERPETLTPEIVEAAHSLSIELNDGFTRYITKAAEKLIAEYGED